MLPKHCPIHIDRLQNQALMDASRRAIDESWELMRALPSASAEIRAAPPEQRAEPAASLRH